MNSSKSVFSNPFIKKRMLRLPDDSFISADKYIKEYVLPKMGEVNTVRLKSGKSVSFGQFINKYVFTICQRDYNGNFDRFYDHYVIDNVNDFFKKNKIDVQRIAKMPESNVYDMYDHYSVISKYIIYNDPVYTKKSVADIVGMVSKPIDYDRNNVADNLNLYFSRNTDKTISYNNRADTMLSYSSDNIVSGLSASFNKEPMTVAELENGKALISENGMHRYHLLRIHYLNELMKTSNESERNQLRNKYMIPVKMETIDLFKTYSNFLIALAAFPIHLSKNRDKQLHQTSDSVLYYNNEKYVFSDKQLLYFLRQNIDKMSGRSSTINKLCEYIPSFNEYINSYFPELVKEDNKKAFSI